MASRKQSHKMKSSITDKREQRLLRVHRRSLDQREMRQEEINRRRQIDDMSPVIESGPNSQQQSCSGTPVQQKAVMSRLERLKKWKEEKELKRKLDAMEKARSKPSFKVVHMTYKDIQLYQKDKAVSGKVAKAATSKPTSAASKKQQQNKAPSAPLPATKPSIAKKVAPPAQPAKKPVSQPVTRTTRSRAAAAKPVSPIMTKAKQPSPKRSGRSNFMAPTAASKGRTTTASKKASVTEKKRTLRQTRKVVANTGNVSTHRGDTSLSSKPSFAPNDFVFEPPSNVSSFVFKPLSPASAASFLFPQGSANNTTMSAFCDRVGRTSTPKREQQPDSAREECSSAKRQRESPASSEETGQNDKSSSQSKIRKSSTAVIVPLSPSGKNGDSEGVTTDCSSKKQMGSRSKTRQSNSVVASSSVLFSKSIESDGMTTDSSTSEENHSRSKTRQSTTATTFSSPPGKTVESDDVTSSDTELSTMPVDNSGSGGDKVFTAELASTPRRSQRHVKEQQASLTVDESEQDQVSDVDRDAVQSAPKRGKRRSRQVAVQEQADEVKEVQSPAKRRRRSRRSVASKTESEARSSLETGIEGILTHVAPSDHTEDPVAGGKTRKSRRSSTSQGKSSVQEESSLMETLPEVEEEAQKPDKGEVSKKGRHSRRSVLPATPLSEEVEPTAMKSTESDTGTNVELVDDGSNKKQQKRHSLVKKQGERPVENTEQVSSSVEPGRPTKKVTLANLASEVTLPEPSTPERQHNLRTRRAKDDMFLTPGAPASSKKQSARRRRTAAMIALSTAKSPEEAIKIIATSPMVEMTRRTPKSKISPEMRKNTTASLFDDDDIPLEPVQLSSKFDEAPTDSHTTDEATTSDNGVTSDDGAASSTADTASEETNSSSGDAGSGKRDVTPFRQCLSDERQKLTQLSDHWTTVQETTSGLSEEVEGQIRTTVCQAQLLMDRKGKFHQFAGLVDKCENGDPSTTCEDLQGFWDMIFIQAEDIYKKFEQLKQMQQNNWQSEKPVAASTTAQAVKVKKAPSGGSKKNKPVVKSKFAAFRAQMLKQRIAEQAGSNSATEEKVFDAGFFKVSSPVRTPEYHCEAGTPSKPQSSKVLAHTLCSDNTAQADKKDSTPRATDDKENVGKVLLRRSMGMTPSRKSYIPAVPSPLLQDGAGAAHSFSPSVISPSKMAAGPGREAEVTTPVRSRRSAAGRRSAFCQKSVCFKEKSEEEKSKEEVVDFMAYLQPSNSQSSSPLKESILDNSPFSCEDILKHSRSDTPGSTSSPSTYEGLRRKSSLKVLPTKERRQSRRTVSVSFAASPTSPGPGLVLPATPYNRDSKVAGKRVTRHSLASPTMVEQSATEELQELSNTLPPRRSARPSLLYTPPKNEKTKTEALGKDVPVAQLISFTP